MKDIMPSTSTQPLGTPVTETIVMNGPYNFLCQACWSKTGSSRASAGNRDRDHAYQRSRGVDLIASSLTATAVFNSSTDPVRSNRLQQFLCKYTIRLAIHFRIIP